MSAPDAGSDLPIILLSHGHGGATFILSLNGYGPVANFWAAHGFVVIQPTHLDSGALGLRGADDPDAPLYTQSRARDMHYILDHLDAIEAVVPGLAGRLDQGRIAAAGHSLGGLTTSMLLGMQVTNPNDGTDVDLSTPGSRPGSCSPGPAMATTSPPGRRRTIRSCATPNFSTMTGPALVVAGDKDLAPMFSERLSYRSDAYTLSPGPEHLLTLFDAEHMLGGVSGYDAAETTDENLERVATLRALAWAYLRTTMYPGDSASADAVAALESSANPTGKVESK